MKKYIEHVRTFDPHDRRQHAIQLSTGILAVVFLFWVTTIGWRFAATPPQTADDTSQVANVNSATYTGGASLIVATTTSY